jgi:hypothetical protein
MWLQTAKVHHGIMPSLLYTIVSVILLRYRRWQPRYARLIVEDLFKRTADANSALHCLYAIGLYWSRFVHHA